MVHQGTAGQPRTVLEAVTQRRFLLTSWPWRSGLYLVSTGPVALLAIVPFALLGVPVVILVRQLWLGETASLGMSGILTALGVLLFAATGPVWVPAVARVERQRLRIVDQRPMTVPSLPSPRSGRGLWTGLTRPVVWRELGYAALLVTVIPLGYAAAGLIVVLAVTLIAGPLLVSGGQPLSLGFTTISSPVGALPSAVAGTLLLPVAAYLIAVLAGVHGLLAKALLTAGEADRLRGELVELSRSRARLVDAFDTERRRIERDLHDGAQQRLVGLTLRLGLAKVDLPSGSAAAEAVADAHDQAKRLMVELRELIRGVHPQALVEFGLPTALDELAERWAMPVTLEVELPGRLAESVESTAYFVVAEAMTNVVKHAEATSATVKVRHHSRGGQYTLIVEVCDDGRGGADPDRGSGLTGLVDRVDVLDGRMSVQSPVGGPTTVRVELPC